VRLLVRLLQIPRLARDFGRSGSGEVTDANQVVEAARQLVMQRLTAQAVAASVEFVVGSDVSIEVKEVPCGFASCKLDDLDVT